MARPGEVVKIASVVLDDLEFAFRHWQQGGPQRDLIVAIENVITAGRIGFAAALLSDQPGKINSPTPEDT